MKIINQILKRITEPTPEFFKKIRLIGIVIGSLITTIVAAEELGIVMPKFITDLVNGYTTLVALMTIFGSSLASAIRDANGEIDQKKVAQIKQDKIEAAKRMYDK